MKHTSQLDRIIAAVPLDGTAGRVTSRGTHWEPKEFKPGGPSEWDVPPQMKRVPINSLNLTGHRHGRFTVLGLLDKPKGSGGAAWVVRCACGKYGTRTAKALRNPANADDCCRACREVKFIKRRYAQLGSKAPEEFK